MRNYSEGEIMNKAERKIIERMKQHLGKVRKEHDDLDAMYYVITNLETMDFYQANEILRCVEKDNSRICDKCKKPMEIIKGAHWNIMRIPAGWKCSCGEQVTTVWGGAGG